MRVAVFLIKIQMNTETSPKNIVYHRIKINENLLELMRSLQNQSQGFRDPETVFNNMLNGSATDTLPAGKIIGIYFNNYIKEKVNAGGRGNYSNPPKKPSYSMAMPPIDRLQLSHTNIRISDTKDHPVTAESDLQDYEHKAGWNDQGYKPVNFDIENNEQIKVSWETIGTAYPPCGEFMFVIEESNCAC